MPPKKQQISALAERLQAAATAYYNSDTLLMTDAEYDAALEQLRALDPKHPLLLKVGAEEEDSTQLPYKMASLNKVHPDSQGGGGAVKRWVARQVDRGAQAFLVTEKLDGLSCMICRRGSDCRVYLRGNGVKGVEVRGMSEYFLLRSIGQGDFVVRGEILLSEANTPQGSIGRSLVNGWIHRAMRGERFPELNKIDFVAYQLIEPHGLSRQQQFAILKTMGFTLPRSTVLGAQNTKDSLIESVLKGWKEVGRTYPLDGIVIAPFTLANEITGAEAELKNPPDMVAFKMVLEDQVRETRIVAIHWSASAQGFLIPRIEIEPVEISGARIQFCSGHNARAIVKGVLGPGARIQLRRSGDVIPTLDTVLEPATSGNASMPTDIEYEWVGETHIRVKEGTDAYEMATAGKRIEHCFDVFGVKGVGPGLIELMIKSGLNTVKKVYDASENELVRILGPGRGVLAYKALRAGEASWSEVDFLVASSLLPRGVGHRKLSPLSVVAKGGHADPREWTRVWKTAVPDGWTRGSLDDFLAALPTAIQWRKDTFPTIPWRCGEGKEELKETAGAGVVVFTGVRDKELEGVMMRAGWSVGDSVTRSTTLVITADGATHDTGKCKKAVALKIPIQNLSQSRKAWNL
jgi:NAD-dependent DNA ligase